MTQIALSRLHFPVTTLGPGRRVGVWLQGCSIRCPGCVSVDTWSPDEGHIDLSQVLATLTHLARDADGLTVSGGEPFDQPEALATLLRTWRSASRGSAFVFTGHEWNAVQPWLASNPELIDAVMTGPFRSDLPQTRALRGSDNQRLRILSPLGQEFAAFEREVSPADRRLDVMFDTAGHAWFAGIPARGDLGRLRRVLASAGHDVTTSDAIGASPQ